MILLSHITTTFQFNSVQFGLFWSIWSSLDYLDPVWSIRSTSIQLGPIQSSSIQFGLFRSSSVLSVQFSPIRFIWVYLSSIGLIPSIWPNSVKFGPFGPLWSISLIQVELNYFCGFKLDYTIYMMRVELINNFPIRGWRFLFLFFYSLFSYIVDSRKCL